MWVGTVTTTGAQTITVTYSSSPGTEEITATEFTAAGVNGATNWGIDASGSQLNTTASTTVTFPSINSTNSDELYVGYSQVQYPPASAGTTTNFNYIITSIQHNVLAYDLSTNANTNYQPTATQSTAGESNAIAIMLTAFVSSSAINNSTSLQKANYYVQASTTGSVAGVLQAAPTGSGDVLDLRNGAGNNVASFSATGATLLQNSTDSTAAFSVQDANGHSILGVDTTNGQVSLGSGNNVDGVLNFYGTANTNAITIASPSTIAASYNLSLPANAPSAGLCLATSPSSATQLVFTSCAQEVTAATISFVNDWSINGTDVTTLADAPANVGDLMVFYSMGSKNSGTIASISGGGVSVWSKVTSYDAGSTNSTTVEMWRGVVTTTGANTLTVTYNSTPGVNELSAIEYTIGSTTGTWDIDTSATLVGSGTTVDYPSLIPTNSSELYTGYAVGSSTMSAGTTPGYSYIGTSSGHYIAYNLSVSGGVATQPSVTQSRSTGYTSIAATIAAYNTNSVIADSTATQQANFNVQAATSGSVAGVLQAYAGGSTADILDVRNNTGNNVAAINSTGLTLGTSQAVGGSLTFTDATDTNKITIAAPTALSSGYNLSLPSAAPTTNMCLSTSAASSSQLVFASCSSQVTSKAISFVKEWDTNGSNITTLNVAPANVGDLMLLWSSPNNADSITSISGGGVNSWAKVTSISGTNQLELWRGIVATTGASTINITYSTGTGTPTEIAATEFSMGSTSGTWVVDNSGTSANGSSTTINYPSLTPQDYSDLYVGYAVGTSTMSAGTTPGYTYLATGLGRYFAYDTSVVGTQQPTATQSTAGASTSIAALIAAFASDSVIANTQAIQEANIYLQAGTAGSVAAVFQPASGGTADSVDINNGSGTLVDSFGNTGNFLVKPSTASASAFQVQNPSGVNVFAVDSSAMRVNVGAGATGETTPSLLVVDSQTGSSTDPGEVNGGIYYNATTNSFRCGVAGAWQTCSGLLYANTNHSASVSTCTNNCGAFSTAASVPAGYCQVGRAIKIVSDGYYSTGTTASSLQLGLYYGTSSTAASSDTLIGTLSPSVSTTSATNYYFQLNYDVVCFSTSSMQAEGTLSIQNSASSSGMLVLPIATTTATTVATSSANNLYIFPIWSLASSSNSATLTQMIVNGY